MTAIITTSFNLCHPGITLFSWLIQFLEQNINNANNKILQKQKGPSGGLNQFLFFNYLLLFLTFRYETKHLHPQKIILPLLSE
jgi:hypothetical protein